MIRRLLCRFGKHKRPLAASAVYPDYHEHKHGDKYGVYQRTFSWACGCIEERWAFCHNAGALHYVGDRFVPSRHCIE